jgi:uncharacterized sulfatase
MSRKLRSQYNSLVFLLFIVASCGASTSEPEPAVEPVLPNLIWIMADDLGYGDLGSYGQELIETPNLDQMAEDGMRFTQFYAGSTVCAPSRSVLMTGQHMGHTWVRGNANKDMLVQTLRPEDTTVAELFKEAGYSTASIGKWGLGEVGSPGHPLKKGFDYFYGYLNQVHAHNYYPEFLWRNLDKVPLENEVQPTERSYGGFVGGHATKKVDYSHDLIVEEALDWIAEKSRGPFFLYLALTIPHANNEGSRATGDGQEVPDYGIYSDRDWTDPNKGQAAMITRMDTDVGRILDLLREHSIAENTLVFFTSDNGHHSEGGNDPEFFDANGPLRGKKRDLYEGGIRVPAIAWWPKTIRPGSVSNHVGYFGDLMATAAELTGVDAPDGLDSISFLRTLKGDSGQPEHSYLYWEFYEGNGGAQAVREGDWKAVRVPALDGKMELYDLSVDLGEEEDSAITELEF